MWNHHSKKTRIPGLGNCALKLYFLAFKVQLLPAMRQPQAHRRDLIREALGSQLHLENRAFVSALGGVTLLLLSNLPRRSLAKQSLASGIQRKQFLPAPQKSLASSSSHWSQLPSWRLGQVSLYFSQRGIKCPHLSRSVCVVWAALRHGYLRVYFIYSQEKVCGNH